MTNAIPGAKMNRFLADPRLADVFGDILRCTCGVLGCTAVAGAISFGAAAPASAVALSKPEPRASIPAICRHPTSINDWPTTRMCREAWWVMYGKSRKRHHGRGGPDTIRWADRPEQAPQTEHRPPPPKPMDKPSPPPAKRPRRDSSPSATPTGSAPSTEPARLTERAADHEPEARSLQPILLLGLLLPAAAAICYPFRHRIYAAAAASPLLSATAVGGVPDTQTVHFTYRPALDPFAAPAMGLSGPGAIATARMLALAALNEHGDSSIVVIPRPDATMLFGLGEDEMLDETAAGLFIPGNLDAALAYLETELAIRQNTGITDARRLLLVADCENEAGRIGDLLARHPGGVSAILLGTWTGERAVVDDDGLVEASSSLAACLPDRLPAMSRTEARDRLRAAIARQQPDKKRPSGRRSSSRRA
ncbi:hypothetical protein [Actinomadura rubrisoli]|uniref:Uncharacterized protein n=1 Tax=Actinomadura rubrisoli TaxID=2530368 RepID=A0A4R5BJP6_9ACTN|nr:hypothetical protein [Actinomadura rubrisoli]TDD85859.1 hypothetical protein E1298_18185 [Actinomadura rubrisoli]